MATSSITADGDAIVVEIVIAAPPERVFAALTDPRQVVQWWGGGGVYRCTEFTSDLRPGGGWRAAGDDGRGGRFEARGEYLVIEPDRRLHMSWTASWTGAMRTTVTWELRPEAGGTRVTLTHGGLAAHPGAAQNYRGWPRMLAWLQALLERGETAGDRA